MKNYNIQYLRGNRHIDDKRYQEMMAVHGVFIPDEALNTPAVLEEYLKENPDKTDYIQRKLAENGLLEEI